MNDDRRTGIRIAVFVAVVGVILLVGVPVVLSLR